MKRTLPLLAAVALLAASCTEKPPAPPPELDERHVITVDGTTVRYNGQLLSWSMPAEEWEKALGPRSRTVEGISVWDDLGVYLHDNDDLYRTKHDQVSSFVVLFGRAMRSKLTQSEPDYWPRETFRGRLEVDGALIHKDFTPHHVFTSKKKGTPFRSGYSRGLYSYDLDGFYIETRFGHDGSLTEFSISAPMPPGPAQAPE
jgi:hypothetical protein